MHDLYGDYLSISTRKTTAAGLSELADGAIGRDRIARLLAGEEGFAAEGEKADTPI